MNKHKDERIHEIKDRTDISEETRQHLLDLEKDLIDTTTLKKLIEDQRAGIDIRNNPIPRRPHNLVVLCRFLYPLFDIGGFLFMLLGGIYSAMQISAIIDLLSTEKWSMLFNSRSLWIVIGYILSMYIIKKVSFLLYRVIHDI